MEKIKSIGIDFGTTNTVISLLEESGEVHTSKFNFASEQLSTFYSALCFWEETRGNNASVRAEGGPWAISAYSQLLDPCRFIQSLKSHAGSAAFAGTHVFRKRMTFEDLLATFLRLLFERAGLDIKNFHGPIIVGRPITFAGFNPSSHLAMERYGKTLSALGLTNFHYAFEPVGAALFYSKNLKSDATIVVGDFGGGTTDFSLVRFKKAANGFSVHPLSNVGIGIAGDAFDYRLVEGLVLSSLGKGGTYKSMGKELEFPNWPFHNLARWHHLSMMKSNGELDELKKLARLATKKGQLDQFVHLIENDLGYALYKSIADVKLALSQQETATFKFSNSGIEIEKQVSRNEFENWIDGDLNKIQAALDATLSRAHLGTSDVDKVFLTGGTSLVPAVRNLFSKAFGEEKIDSGDQFVSISQGLALIGGSSDMPNWIVHHPE